jgi:hypothetical protein
MLLPEGRQLPRLVFINVAIRAIGKKEAITELRRMADWVERTDTRTPPN